jgi:hypothetical protein
MGDAGRDVLKAAEPKGWRDAVAPAPMTKLRPISPRSSAPHAGVMFMLPVRHRDALQEAARRLRDDEGGRGRVDASRVLRALLEDWIAAGAELPGRAREGA